VLSQWLGTSLWFSPSGAADGLMARLAIDGAAFGWLIAATQLGFIAGTLAFAATGFADRFGASRIFAVSCVAGAATNAALALPGVEYAAAWGLRFAVGLCLAGIYPLGMKMIVQWVGGRPAAALGWLVGMLTLGTAMPHALRASGASWPWEAVLIASSVLALVGAALFFWGFCVVADSPQFSALSSQFAPPQLLGSALVAQNGIGFLITVASILVLSRAVPAWGATAMWILVPGPVLGLCALRPLLA